HNHGFVYIGRISGQSFDRSRHVSEECALEEPAMMFAVEANPRHDIRSAKALWIFQRLRRDQVPAFQIVESQHDCRRADVDGETMNWTVRLGDRLTIEQHLASVANRSRIERRHLLWQSDGFSFDAQRTTPQRVATHFPGGCDPRSARQTESALQMIFLRSR